MRNYSYQKLNACMAAIREAMRCKVGTPEYDAAWGRVRDLGSTLTTQDRYHAGRLYDAGREDEAKK